MPERFSEPVLHSDPHPRQPSYPQRATLRRVAVALLIGTVLYVVPTVLHGNPPVDSARETLEYVHDRPTWRAVHLVNILAVLIWASAFTVLSPVIAPRAAGLRRVVTAVFTAAAAVFAVYFSIHAFALPTAAHDYFERGADRAAVLERAETVLVLLGSTAFTSQALLGLSIALCGALLTRAAPVPAWLGWTGVAAGAGWLLGALLVNFAVIVPFTVLTWVWLVALAVRLLRHPRAAIARAHRASVVRASAMPEGSDAGGHRK